MFQLLIHAYIVYLRFITRKRKEKLSFSHRSLEHLKNHLIFFGRCLIFRNIAFLNFSFSIKKIKIISCLGMTMFFVSLKAVLKRIASSFFKFISYKKTNYLFGLGVFQMRYGTSFNVLFIYLEMGGYNFIFTRPKRFIRCM